MSLDIFRSCRQRFINDFCGYDIPIPVLEPYNRVTRSVIERNVVHVPFFQPSSDPWW